MHTNVHAIVLSSKPYKEGDKFLSLFTLELGRLNAVAAGARKSQARLGAATEPGAESQFRLWVKDVHSVARITGGGTLRPLGLKTRHWARMNSVSFLCEWTHRMTAERQPLPEKYTLLQKALGALAAEDPALVRTAFLFQFFEHAGYNADPDEFGGIVHSDTIRELLDYDFATPPPSCPSPADLAVWEKTLIDTAAPLLQHPLKTHRHKTSMENFLVKATA
ncbi:MAG TPA: DNA repair protein RecO [Elusimicrobiota bacterium]|nr:DNA repair protein RecO [Elusimicrobiota bacterium]